jgi:hypothetical protein
MVEAMGQVGRRAVLAYCADPLSKSSAVFKELTDGTCEVC